ncbi:hypothetical protein PDJAM_G00121160 [Pangasius djambal]|uniref:Uncharacterized protein n=1 Tax=Pangasius djambal TaxID=1691987 RepID=A0ACC5ZAP9_9TELE|nr:hypothetical protein [Pangasius djambal]
MYPESTTDSPARLSLRQTGSPGMIYSARYGSPKRQLQFYRKGGLALFCYPFSPAGSDGLNFTGDSVEDRVFACLPRLV